VYFSGGKCSTCRGLRQKSNQISELLNSLPLYSLQEIDPTFNLSAANETADDFDFDGIQKYMLN
jgi:hypothetical protein